MVCWAEQKHWQRLTCRSTRAATPRTNRWLSNSRWLDPHRAFRSQFTHFCISLKHDVMYHHGMGGPPQRPLQVRIFCLIIVGRRTKVLSLDRWGGWNQGKDCRTWNNKNARQPDAKSYQNELNNFTNNWTLPARHLNVEWCIAGHVATLKRASGNVNWVVTSFNAFQFADCASPRFSTSSPACIDFPVNHALADKADRRCCGRKINSNYRRYRRKSIEMDNWRVNLNFIVYGFA